MKVSAARAAAADWVRRHAAREPGFVGAYFSGSTVYLPLDAELPVGSDVDVMVVSEREGASHGRTKFVHDGALIEASSQPWSTFASVDTVHSAHSLRFDSIIADPSGRLAAVRAVVVREFAEPSRVRRRCRGLWTATVQALGDLDPHAPWPSQVMDWAFKTSWTALLLLVADLRNPTVRLRYLAAREVLAEHGLTDRYPDLLDQLGCRDLTRERAEHHLEELALTFDAATGVARTKFGFSSDISAIARPVAIDGIGEQIRLGNHREVVFWLVATYSRCHEILAADAPELDRERGPAFAAMLGDLRLRSPDDLANRAQATVAFLPALWDAMEAIMDNPRQPRGHQPV
ncbi:MAG TPA: hypothetical protein VE953_00535 [Terriglobales bacterium]|nr:hypothetical protein [Terriglobales bacterium]